MKSKTKNISVEGFMKGDTVKLNVSVKPKYPGKTEGVVVAFFEKPAGNAPAKTFIGVSFSNETYVDANGVKKNKHLQWVRPIDLIKLSKIDVENKKSTLSLPPLGTTLCVSEQFAFDASQRRSEETIQKLKIGSSKCVNFKKGKKAVDYAENLQDEFEKDAL